MGRMGSLGDVFLGEMASTVMYVPALVFALGMGLAMGWEIRTGFQIGLLGWWWMFALASPVYLVVVVFWHPWMVLMWPAVVISAWKGLYEERPLMRLGMLGLVMLAGTVTGLLTM